MNFFRRNNNAKA